MTDALYPSSPALADTSFLEPSADFKGRTYRMIFGILAFIFLYLLLILFSIGLLVGCSMLAIAIVSFHASWLTIVLALGLFALGVMFFFFTIKFIFASTTEHERLEIRIHEKDHPALFQFIRKLSKEVGTDFPRKIFLVPEVNAFVSYNSSFWSMFLPIRKNLRIGLGLVNSLNLSEFKATIAHEFGHFSQRSMKTGSYVYTMNKIIFNLAYQRDKFDDLLIEWASTGGTFSIFAAITSSFVEGVRSMLRSSYNKLNVTYLALSREMEYHADLVACSVAGNDAMVNTLRKIEFADTAYNEAINGLSNMARKNKRKVEDIYSFHSKTMSRLAIANKLTMNDGLPIITSADFYKNVAKSRLVMKDQWSSHPSREEREASIGRYMVQSPLVQQSAWALFTNPEAIRQAMTKELYVENETLKDLSNMNDKEVDEFIQNESEHHSISPTFKGVYDSRLLSKFDPEKITRSTTKKFDDLFNESVNNTVRKYFRDASDMDQLEAIHQKRIRIDFFEYDGMRYKSSEAFKLLENLSKEVSEGTGKMEALDEDIFVYYRQRANERGEAQEYIDLFKKLSTKRLDHEIATDFASRLHNMTQEMQSRVEWREDQLTNLCSRTQQLEKQVKNFMRDLPADLIQDHFAEPDNVFKYLKTERLWNESERVFNNEGFGQLHQYVISSISVANEEVWDVVNEIYKKQLELTPQEFLID